MIASAHLAAGLVAGVASARNIRPGPARLVVALVAGLATHALLDAIPHSDYDRLPRSSVLLVIMAEAAVVGALAAWWFGGRVTREWRGPIAAGLLGSALPDAKFVALLLFPDQYARTVEYFGDRLHAHFHAAPVAPTTGMVIQVLCAVGLLATLFMLRPGSPGRRQGAPLASPDDDGR